MYFLTRPKAKLHPNHHEGGTPKKKFGMNMGVEGLQSKGKATSSNCL
jgi:hypothetical protein